MIGSQLSVKGILHRASLITMFIGFTLSMEAYTISNGESVLIEGEDNPREFYSLDIGNSKIAGKSGSVLGANWNYGLTEGLAGGFFVKGLISSIDSSSENAEGSLSFYYGGLRAEYRLPGYWVVSNSSAANLGGGRIGFRSVDGEYEEAGFFVLEPEISSLINLTAKVQTGLGLSYRIVKGAELDGAPPSSLTSPTIAFILRTRN